MSKTKKNRGRKFKNKNVKNLIKFLKRMNKREDALIEHVRDLEFYMATLEEVFFEDSESDGDLMVGSGMVEEIEEEIPPLFTMDQVLEELKTPKKKKKKKKNEER